MEVDNDKTWWMGETSWRFTVKSQIIRKKQEQSKIYNYIWPKGLPVKISFFMWSVWKGRIPTDNNLEKININLVSRC